MSLRVLFTARDAAAALHLIEIARPALASAEFDVLIVTQDPATRYFRDAKISTRHLDLNPAHMRTGIDATNLLNAARLIIEEFRPHAVLCGLSTPKDGGIDEAVLASFDGPSFMMQDFWGEANGFFGRKAQLFFALDEEAVHLTALRHGIEAVAVGSPRHSAYAQFDLADTRSDVRKHAAIAPEALVFGFFGQGLHALEGYRSMVTKWAKAVSGQSHAIAAYRPHPRESHAEVRWTQQVFRECGLQVLALDDMPVEHAIIVSDVVCSAFSNCTYDAAFLNYFSDQPLTTPVSLFFEPDVIEYFRRMLRLEQFPYLKDGLVKLVDEASILGSKIAEAAGPDDKQQFWEAAKRNLRNPIGAPILVLNEIRSRVG